MQTNEVRPAASALRKAVRYAETQNGEGPTAPCLPWQVGLLRCPAPARPARPPTCRAAHGMQAASGSGSPQPGLPCLSLPRASAHAAHFWRAQASSNLALALMSGAQGDEFEPRKVRLCRQRAGAAWESGVYSERSDWLHSRALAGLLAACSPPCGGMAARALPLHSVQPLWPLPET